MPRRKRLKVVERPPLGPGPYTAEVLSAEIINKSQALLVELQLLDMGQAGRRVAFSLDLPLYPDSTAADSLRATRGQVEPGTEVDPSESAGATILVRFRQRDGSHDVVSFDPVSARGEAPERGVPQLQNTEGEDEFASS